MLAGAGSSGCWLILGTVLPWVQGGETFQPPTEPPLTWGALAVGVARVAQAHG